MKLILPTLGAFVAMTVTAFAGTDMKEIAAPQAACTSDAGLYLAVFGGATFAQGYGDRNAQVSTPAIPGASIDINGNHNNNTVGGVGGIKVGYNFESFDMGGGFRLQPAVEGEAFYLGMDNTNSYSQTILGTPVNASIKGNYNNAAFFANGILRLKTPSIVTPYIGAGVGGEYFNFSNGTAAANVGGTGGSLALPNADTICFALQATGGLEFALAKHWSLFTEYKFIAAVNPDLDFGTVANVGGTPIDAHFNPNFVTQHVVTAGVKYSF